MKTKKPKAVRVGEHDGYLYELAIQHRKNGVGWFIPDGAPIPLPASVRRVMRELKRWDAWVDDSCVKSTEEYPLRKAYKAHQAAEARREES
jgi:hypothetical protein